MTVFNENENCLNKKNTKSELPIFETLIMMLSNCSYLIFII